MGEPRLLVVMGVSGSGKTAVAVQVAEQLGWQFADADDFHPSVNVDKMAAGEPLTDDDRWPWLYELSGWLSEQSRAGSSAVIACSSLRRAYRDVLRQADGRLFFVHLAGEASVIRRRLEQRSGHYMPPELLQSQFDVLEPLENDESGMTLDIDVGIDGLTRTCIAITQDARSARE